LDLPLGGRKAGGKWVVERVHARMIARRSAG
jgi:hypothetical protein